MGGWGRRAIFVRLCAFQFSNFPYPQQKTVLSPAAPPQSIPLNGIRFPRRRSSISHSGIGFKSRGGRGQYMVSNAHDRLFFCFLSPAPPLPHFASNARMSAGNRLALMPVRSSLKYRHHERSYITRRVAGGIRSSAMVQVGKRSN